MARIKDVDVLSTSLVDEAKIQERNSPCVEDLQDRSSDEGEL